MLIRSVEDYNEVVGRSRINAMVQEPPKMDRFQCLRNVLRSKQMEKYL